MQVAEHVARVASRPEAGKLRFLASRRWRIFLIAWIVYSVHFATNVVREHYPAFTLAEHGTLRVDEYQGFHADIFVHRDGHSVVGNQVFTSVLAAVPLFIFDPVLDALEEHSKRKLAVNGLDDAEYRTDKPNRVKFFRLVKERGLDLRFGAATAITSAFFMAPLTALFLVLMYSVLISRGVRPGAATGLTLLLGFGTPLFFRTAHLNHNMFIMYALFIAFVLLWVQPGQDYPVSLRNRLAAGFFGGITLANDYIGVILLPLLYAYLFFPRLQTVSWKQSFRESLAMVAGSIPPVLFLLYTQWVMYGHPFWPGQHWMPQQNIYTEVGLRGFTGPAPDLIFLNLFHPGYGLYTWGPLFLLALVPVFRYRAESLILPRRERLFVVACFVAVLLFSSANQYARLQWNSGFRYLIPLVPFLFLALTDHWIRLPRRFQIAIGAVVLLHSWVLTVFRESVQRSWSLFLREGVQLPWLRVLRMTSSEGNTFLSGQILPLALLAGTGLVVSAIWWYGQRLEVRSAVHELEQSSV